MVERLSHAVPGAELAAALASIDRTVLEPHDLVTLMRERARQVAHDQGELLADLVAVADFDDPHTPSELAQVAFDCAVAQIAVALTWTRRAADGWLGLARDAVRRLPDLHAALLAGRLDLPKVRVFADELTAAGDDAARQVVARLLPEAPDLTTGQLRVRIRKLIATADPQQAAARYRQGVAGRHVDCHAGSDGTAALTGWQLPADRAVAAAERLDALAKAAKCAGDGRSMDQLRADAFLGLLNGDYDGPPPVHRRGVVELTVPLTTLMELSAAPGELAGFGPVVADVARRTAAEQREQTTWRYSVLDDAGRVIHHGITRRRPIARDAAFVRARDRRCVFPGCRVPAGRCEIDHRRRHTDGGSSTEDNLETLCRWHHRCKDEGGWTVKHLDNGHYLWTSPARHTYVVAPEPIHAEPCGPDPPG